MISSATELLERFQAKWIPVRVKKTRQNKRIEPRSDSIGTEKALELRFRLDQNRSSAKTGLTSPPRTVRPFPARVHRQAARECVRETPSTSDVPAPARHGLPRPPMENSS